MEQNKLQALREAARQIRIGIIKSTNAAKSGHPTGFSLPSYYIPIINICQYKKEKTEDWFSMEQECKKVQSAELYDT